MDKAFYTTSRRLELTYKRYDEAFFPFMAKTFRPEYEKISEKFVTETPEQKKAQDAYIKT
jgi:hypothetical protein